MKSGSDKGRGLGALVVSGDAAGPGSDVGPLRWSPFGWRSEGGNDEGWGWGAACRLRGGLCGRPGIRFVGRRAPDMTGLPQVPRDDHGDGPDSVRFAGTIPMIIARGGLRGWSAPGSRKAPHARRNSRRAAVFKAPPRTSEADLPMLPAPARARGGSVPPAFGARRWPKGSPPTTAVAAAIAAPPGT
ncbi:hypothetical protein GCM10009799_13910 [Nocardiopsis rhodophaea]|uniref:Uncharacterized protein n=1 Tax=Nocardiopsis rhodophaea TaxID=280238 RepID=A0ABN2SN31_9ACTN